MTGKDIYEVWAPAFDEWSPWVKPVLFAEIDATTMAMAPEQMPVSGLAAAWGPGGTRRWSSICRGRNP